MDAALIRTVGVCMITSVTTLQVTLPVSKRRIQYWRLHYRVMHHRMCHA